MDEYITIEDDSMFDYFSNAGFRYSDEVLSRYYLSLKTKPFVILTGISGTGKTKIAQIFAEYICQFDTPSEKKKRIAFIPVRPDWMDNRSLLGYYNVLQETYVQTPLLELLLAAKRNPSKPHFVILDEMNLAKVEYYFSDFLSILESRTPDNPHGEAINLYDKEQKQDSNVPYKIHIPENVYFTGTVNVDESTYMFSPKVLDRSNVIEFNEVSLPGMDRKYEHDVLRLKENTHAPDGLSSGSSLCSIKDYEKLLKKHPECTNAISELLILLEGGTDNRYNMHFGYRVANEMARFILLSSDAVDNFRWEEALDIQIIQKILPKIHGTKTKLDNPIKEMLNYASKHEFNRSKRKLENMLMNLNNDGYTSFIE